MMQVAEEGRRVAPLALDLTRDSCGNPIPERLRKQFEWRNRLWKLRKQFDDLIRDCTHDLVFETEYGSEEIVAKLLEIRKEAFERLPHTSCDCQWWDLTCRKCKGKRWLSKADYHELRERARKSADTLPIERRA